MSGAFSSAFASAFDAAAESGLVTTTWTASVDDHFPRPRWPPWSPLWERFGLPRTQVALLLWRDGRVEVADTEGERNYNDADAVILGGYQWVVPEDDWTVNVMRSAGFPVVPYEGPV